MLIDVTTEDRMDQVSSHGYALGLYRQLHTLLCSVLHWSSAMIPSVYPWIGYGACFRSNRNMVGTAFSAAIEKLSAKPLRRILRKPIRSSFGRLASVLRELRQQKGAFFLLAFFCFIDGVYTVIDMATAYGTALGLDTTGLLLALLRLKSSPSPPRCFFGRLSAGFPLQLMLVCIAAYFLYIPLCHRDGASYQFWILAMRRHLSGRHSILISVPTMPKSFPSNRSGEYFGLYDIWVRAPLFRAYDVVSLVSQLTGRSTSVSAFFPLCFWQAFSYFGKRKKFHK